MDLFELLHQLLIIFKRVTLTTLGRWCIIDNRSEGTTPLDQARADQ